MARAAPSHCRVILAVDFRQAIPRLESSSRPDRRNPQNRRIATLSQDRSRGRRRRMTSPSASSHAKAFANVSRRLSARRGPLDAGDSFRWREPSDMIATSRSRLASEEIASHHSPFAELHAWSLFGARFHSLQVGLIGVVAALQAAHRLSGSRRSGRQDYRCLQDSRPSWSTRCPLRRKAHGFP